MTEPVGIPAMFEAMRRVRPAARAFVLASIAGTGLAAACSSGGSAPECQVDNSVACLEGTPYRCSGGASPADPSAACVEGLAEGSNFGSTVYCCSPCLACSQAAPEISCGLGDCFVCAPGSSPEAGSGCTQYGTVSA
jgi:hypothetical protein